MNDEQLLRYSRQIMLPEMDIEGQEKLLAARVLIVGMGGLGCPVALYLAAAGLGQLVLVDHDRVDLSNLQRQIAHKTSAVDEFKVISAARSIAELNPDIDVQTINHQLAGVELIETIGRCDVVLDATDNFEARYAINDACWKCGIPLVSGAAIRWEGQVAVFDPRSETSPCYRCLYAEGDDEALNCAENGVAAPLVGIIGTCQAMETIKLITGVGETLTGSVLYFDGKAMEWRKLGLSKDPRCPTCRG
ncbi:MAG: molybdopterin-synthase adenylyltransferase MoeB [Gammaproteobacteria bacterium]|nr:molybdopterin-synthase adenylyltransferase MoeB [Gammaproteobacteria bacterium]